MRRRSHSASRGSAAFLPTQRPHVLWKGNVRFGLVTIPVALEPAETRDELDFTLLDERDLSPIGYAKVNKRTGRAVAPQHVVKGYEIRKRRYVVLTEQDLRRADPEATQTVEVFGFVEPDQIPPTFFERPYYLAPLCHGEKPYALLREALVRSGRVGLARIVIRTRQYVAALFASGPALTVNLLRYAHELRDPAELRLPAAAAAGVERRELEMAEQLIGSLAVDWKPASYRDEYRADLLALIERKSKARGAAPAEPEPPAEEPRGAEVVDLMALLKKSLAEPGRRRSPAERAARARARRSERRSA